MTVDDVAGERRFTSIRLKARALGIEAETTAKHL